jgi:hypothetical protein
LDVGSENFWGASLRVLVQRFEGLVNDGGVEAVLVGFGGECAFVGSAGVFVGDEGDDEAGEDFVVDPAVDCYLWETERRSVLCSCFRACRDSVLLVIRDNGEVVFSACVLGFEVCPITKIGVTGQEGFEGVEGIDSDGDDSSILVSASGTGFSLSSGWIVRSCSVWWAFRHLRYQFFDLQVLEPPKLKVSIGTLGS